MSVENDRTHAHDYLDLAHICGHLIRRSQQVHTVLWTEEFGSELTSPQYSVLAALAHRPLIDQRQLGEVVSLDKSSTADVVARLESNMWLRRTRDANDGRRNILELSPAAVIAFERLTPVAQRVQDRLIEPIPEADRVDFLAWLASVARLSPARMIIDSVDYRAASQIDVPGHLIRRAQQIHTSIWAEVFDRELTGPQYATLQVLAQSPEINQRELGERAALDKSTTADIVQRLVRRGWVTSRRDPLDGRGRVLRLGDDALQLTQDFAPKVAVVQERLLEPLPETVREEFLGLLAMVAYAGSVPGAM